MEAEQLKWIRESCHKGLNYLSDTSEYQHGKSIESMIEYLADIIEDQEKRIRKIEGLHLFSVQ